MCNKFEHKHTVLVTGGAGFIGSNFIPYFLDQHPSYKVVNIDKLTYAGNLDNLKEVADHPRYQFIKGDINNRNLIEYIFGEYDVKGVIHFAAESHVDNSISYPDVFIRTNINGTFTLLDVARKHWMSAPHNYKVGYDGSRFHHISTDEVYGSLGPSGLFTEDTAYAPNSPYSASKASSDLIVQSYFHTYGMNVVISNCSNNYGPKQHSEKLIPTIILQALAGKTIPIYGDGKNIRDWIYVMDHCKGINLVYHSGRSGESYNIGGRNEQENIYIAQIIGQILDEIALEKRRAFKLNSFQELIGFVTDRPGHDQRYAIDAGKIERELGWQAQESFESGILKTVKWYEKYGK
jgi:dTDP-glucose 4,6-dehydratase